jgi:pimeloyl-ACP methyl ester carboxylesterase
MTTGSAPPRWSRRRLLGAALGGIAGAAFAGVELVEHGVLPGKGTLDRLDGACSVATPALSFARPGPTRSGAFFSSARRRTVGYTIAYPPGRGPGDALPLAVYLHGYGGDHTSGFGAVSLSRALAAHAADQPLAPFAIAAADGGGLYWNRHPGDDPLTMVVSELIPLCRRLGLGHPPHGVGAVGLSMGGYGALLLAESHPRLVSAVAALSPAVWTSYEQARAANGGAFASAADFAADDVIAHAHRLSGIPVRVLTGRDDPFRPGVAALARALPAGATVTLAAGCHDDAFWAAHQHAALAFLGRRLTV